MAAAFQQQQATSKYSLAAMLQSENIVGAVRRELRRAFPGLKVDEGQILAALQNEVLKRELIDSEEATAATVTLKRALRAVERSKTKVETAATASPVGAAGDLAPPAAV
jgi:hypothetical protein